jgi:ATP phosphoribosyltransferase regulatory subunit HisZ
MQRRRLLQLGLGAAALLAIGGGAAALVRPGLVDGRMTTASRGIFSAVARVVLEGSLPTEAAPRQQALEAHLARVDATIAGLPPAVRDELSTLLALLATAPGRMGLAGLSADWPEATVPQLHQAMQALRTSSLAMRQQVYLALRELTNASYYADPSTWSLLGYPGPTPV